MRFIKLFSILTAVVLLSATTAFAGALCTGNVNFDLDGSKGIHPNLGCQLGDQNNDVESISDKGIDMLGNGTGDWVFMGKVEGDGDGDIDGTDGALTVNGDGGSGTLSFASTLFSMDGMTFEVVAVLKGPNPEVFVAYLLDPDACVAGTCTYDYFNVFSNPDSISHISLYYRKVGTSVPEPSSLILLGLGLTALGLARRRR